VKTEEIRELITYFETTKLSKFVLKRGDFEIHLEKGGTPIPYFEEMVHPVSHAREEKHHAKHGEHAPVGTFVTSPMVGTFYSAPASGQPPFVKVGDHVQAHTVVCIVEAMKVMNEVKAGVSGKIVEILVDNAHPVEFGARLFRVQPQ
jgi:acetyl-CoA carboxylase biotin carboxyl carrier protein